LRPEDLPSDNIFTGEIGVLRKKAAERSRKLFDIKNPYYAEVISKKDLHEGGDRTIMLIRIDLGKSDIHYQAGDHIGIFPRNNENLVKRLAERLAIKDLDALFTMTSIDCINDFVMWPAWIDVFLF
jgi:NADPH-ferrihemoprotein reductase